MTAKNSRKKASSSGSGAKNRRAGAKSGTERTGSAVAAKAAKAKNPRRDGRSAKRAPAVKSKPAAKPQPKTAKAKGKAAKPQAAKPQAAKAKGKAAKGKAPAKAAKARGKADKPQAAKAKGKAAKAPAKAAKAPASAAKAPAKARKRPAPRRALPIAEPAETPITAYSGPVKRVKLPEGYRPSEDEPFMNPYQAEYFRHKLLAWRGELLRDSEETLAHLKETAPVSADLADRAMIESERTVELRTRDRERKLIAKIDAALRRLDEGTYGYCEVTGQPIGLKRLEARPIATLSIEAQERHERMERIYRED